MTNPKEQITPNFQRDELWCPCCGAMPSQHAIVWLQRLRTLLGLPMRLNSAMRCERYNITVGGSADSQHTKGRAFDVHIPNASYRFALIQRAIETGVKGLGIYNSMVHIDIRTTQPTAWIGF